MFAKIFPCKISAEIEKTFIFVTINQKIIKTFFNEWTKKL